MFNQAENNAVEEEINSISSKLISEGFEKVVKNERPLGLGGSLNEFRPALLPKNLSNEANFSNNDEEYKSDDTDEFYDDDIYEDNLDDDFYDKDIDFDPISEGSVIPMDLSKYENTEANLPEAGTVRFIRV